jgi:outer membrane protein OmpA-like peptidoglycan-associated protein
MTRKPHWRLASVALAVLALQACTTVPPDNVQLSEATSYLRTAQDKPAIISLAPAELKDAELALDQAQAAWNRGDTSAQINHLSYIAKQKVAIAEEVTHLRIAESNIAQAPGLRNQLLLEARTREAATAQRSAETAQRSADTANQQAAASAQDAAAARQANADTQAYAGTLQSRLDDLHATRTDRGMVVTIGDLLFDTNSATLKSGGGRNVQRLGEFLMAYPQRNALVEGYTDSVGSAVSNQDLSERRASAVREALVAMGVAGNRVAMQGFGESFPVSSNQNAEGRQSNRRVEVILSEDGTTIVHR